MFLVACFFFFNDTATTEIYTVLTHSFPTRRSSDLDVLVDVAEGRDTDCLAQCRRGDPKVGGKVEARPDHDLGPLQVPLDAGRHDFADAAHFADQLRSEEHTSELQSLMRISYAVFCLKKKKLKTNSTSVP